MNDSKPDPVDVHVGQRLRAARNLKSLSQQNVAVALGLTFQQIQKYERASNRIAASKLVQLSKLLDQPVEWFFVGAPGYGARPPEGEDVAATFFALPYAADIAKDYIAIAHNLDRDVVRSVARALSRVGAGR